MNAAPYRFGSLVAVAAIVATGAVAGAQESEGRYLTIADLFRLESVSLAAVSPDGAQVAYLVGTADLEGNKRASAVWLVPVAGGDPRRMTAEDAAASRPRFSPDGRWLSFLATRGEGAKQQVWGLDLSGGEAQQLTKVKQGVRGYEWAPDAKRLALVVRDEGPEREEDAPQRPWVVDRLQFKRDYVGYLDRLRPHLYVLDLASGELTQLTRGDYDHSSPVWSPEGTRIAFVSNRTAEPDSNYNTDIWVIDVAAGANSVPAKISTSVGPDAGPTWNPAGDRIAWLTSTRTDIHGYALQYVAIGALGKEPRVLTEATDRNIRSLRFSADGKHILGVLETEGAQHLVEVSVDDGATRTLWGGERRVSAVAPLPGGGAVVAATSARVPTNLWVVEASGQARQLTRHNEELLQGLRLGPVVKERTTAADGTEVEAFFTFPPDAEEGARLPTILWIHGGPMGQDDWGWGGQRQLFAAHGYLVVQPNYRGSHGYGQKFAIGLWQKWGGPERVDAIAAVDHAIERGWADPERLGVGGWSYGGITTNAIITNTGRFKAAVSGASDALWVASYGHDQYQRWYEAELGLPWENRELWERLSTYNRVEQITTPTLWIGGEKDWNVPIIQSELMYQAMKRLGRETLLVVYPGQGHGGFPPVYQSDVYRRFLGWFGRYLTGDDSAWPEED